MIKYEITGKNIEVTDAIHNAIIESLDNLDAYFADRDIIAKVVVRTYKVGQKIEVTFLVDHSVVARQEMTHDNLYAAIDLVGKKLEKQIRRINDRIASHKKRNESVAKAFNITEDKKEDTKTVSRRKTIVNKPMDEEEAILQFEIFGHDFFIFEDSKVETTKVLYKRKDGEYGIIELEN